VASALVHGRLGASELRGEILTTPLVLHLSDSIELIEDDQYNARFPAERFARVIIETSDGQIYDSGPVQPSWDANDPPSDEELRAKFCWLAGEMMPLNLVNELEETIWHCAELIDAKAINHLLTHYEFT
jgi:2-methylcitrate dehydratase PrpD